MLTNFNQSSNTISSESIKKENLGLFESTLSKNSPRTPRNDITSTNRRRRYPKLKTVNHSKDSASSGPNLDLLNSSIRTSSFKLNSSAVDCCYQYNRGDSEVRSEFQTQDMSNSNSEMVKKNPIEFDTKFVSVDAGANRATKKIIFLIPADLEASVEIMKVQSIASVSSQVHSLLGDKLFSGINLPVPSTLLSQVSTRDVSDFIGPIKSQSKKKQKKRKSPYARLDNQENHRPSSSGKKPSDARDFASEELKFVIPESFVPRNYQQAQSSAGPIRSKPRRSSLHKRTAPLRSYSNSPYEMPSPDYGNARTNGNYCTPNVVQPAATIDDQCTRYCADLHLRGVVNNRNKLYHNNSKFRRIKLCWNCQSDSHLFRQCPLL